MCMRDLVPQILGDITNFLIPPEVSAERFTRHITAKKLLETSGFLTSELLRLVGCD